MIPLKSCTGFLCQVHIRKNFIIKIKGAIHLFALVCIFVVLVSNLKAQEKKSSELSGFKDSKSIGAAWIPVIGWGVSIGIGVADMIWGDDFYKWVDKQVIK